jgi:hypothetical protein
VVQRASIPVELAAPDYLNPLLLEKFQEPLLCEGPDSEFILAVPLPSLGRVDVQQPNMLAADRQGIAVD